VSLPPLSRLFQAMDATWTPKAIHKVGPWLVREDPGGGQRVAATTATREVNVADIAAAETAMRDLGQTCLFSLTTTDAALDVMLQDRGYEIVDPVLMIAAEISEMTLPYSKPLDAIPCALPLALQAEFWAQNGIGPGRLDVMARTKGPKAYLFSRHKDRPAGAAFVAVDDTIAMLHALCIDPNNRRQNLAARTMARAAIWAAENGANTLAVATTRENLPAQALFTSLNMSVVGNYHYRRKTENT